MSDPNPAQSETDYFLYIAIMLLGHTWPCVQSMTTALSVRHSTNQMSLIGWESSHLKSSH